MVTHLAGGAKEGAKSGALEGAADAHTLYSNGRELCHAQLNALQSHYNIHRAIHRTDHGGDVLPGGEARGIENIGAGVLIRLQPLDRVFEIRPAVQVVFRAGSQGEGKGQSSSCRHRRANAFHSMVDFIAVRPSGKFYWKPGDIEFADRLVP